MADELRLSLLENAEDFLREAVKYAKASSPRDWKYAALHLWSALELVLKTLLETEHWSLLFEDVNKASRKKLREGDFQTVRFDTALERINGIVGVSIGERDLRYLRQLRDLRNRMTHSAVKLNIEQAKSVVARGISVFLTYDVFSGTAYHATVCVQDDGRKVWTFDPQWKDFWVDADKQKVIEQAIDHHPNASILSVEGFAIKQRSV